MSRQHFQYQSEHSECGLACVATCASLLGRETTLSSLRIRHPSSSQGTNAAALISAFTSLGIHARAIRCEVEDLQHISLPAVLHWKLSHFVVLSKCSRGRFHIFDPASGHMRLSGTQVSESFTGVALELTRLPGFVASRSDRQFSIRRFATITSEVKQSLGLGAVYSVFLQLFLVSSPFFIQISVDEAATHTDTDLLVLLGLGFALLAIFNFIAEVLRSRAMSRAASTLSWNASRRLFRHMILLPLSWFERRRLADVSSRFDTMDSLKQALTGGLVSAVMDGILSLLLVATMFFVSPVLALVGSSAAALYLGLSWASSPVRNKLGGEAFQASLREKTARIETIRSIASIKSAGAELNREAEWSARLADATNAGNRLNSLLASLSASRTLLDNLATAGAVYLGVHLLLDQALTVGALFAFFALKRQLSARIHTFVQQITAFRQTVLHSDRLADIVLSESELMGPEAMDHPPLEGRIYAQNVYYRYGQSDEFSVKALNIAVHAGDFVLLNGPSGCGKSTIMKLLAGLYPPQQGEIRYDGTALSTPFSRSIRSQIGVVMQGDELLGGSIGENVAFFSEDAEPESIWRCLTLAGLATEVKAMPLQLQTRIGEIGSSLSAGQRQRLLIARALYRRPRVLLLDEATANVDLDKEREIFLSLRSIGITIIAVTHRPQIASLATLLATCAGGSITSVKRVTPEQIIPGRKAPSLQDQIASREVFSAPS